MKLIVLAFAITTRAVWLKAQNVPIPAGNPCKRNRDNRVGICLPITKCEVAYQALLARKSIPVGTCSFTRHTEIVCCPRSTRKAEQACNNYKAIVKPRAGLYISFGNDADYGEFPHMAALGYRDRQSKITWGCGGSLISEFFILTASHCFRAPVLGDPKIARLGDTDIVSNEDDRFAINYPIAQLIYHPLYTSRSSYNDIGLVRLRRRVKFNDKIFPLCLHTRHRLMHNGMIITGWGTKGAIQMKDTDKNWPLQRGNINVVDMERCNASFLALPTFQIQKSISVSRGIAPTMICAADTTKRANFTDTCQGDSGGPLQYLKGDLYYIVGVTAFGMTCPGSTPGVYTRISRYIDWITYHVWP